MTGLLGREQGAGQGLAKRSHFISQGSPFAPPPPPINPPLPVMLSQPFRPPSLVEPQRQESLWPDSTECSAGFRRGCASEAARSCLVQFPRSVPHCFGSEVGRLVLSSSLSRPVPSRPCTLTCIFSPLSCSFCVG